MLSHSDKVTDQIKKTAKNSAIYAVGTILRRITALVMLPIYTRYLSPADYGVIELLSMAIEMASILIGLRISQAMFRYYILADSQQEKRTVVSTVLITVAFSSILGASIMYLLADDITYFIFGNSDYVFEFRLFVFTLVTNAIGAVGMSYLRARQMPVFFVAVSIAMLMIQVTLNIVFVVMLEMHVTGVVYAALLSGIIVGLGLTVFIVANVGVHYSKEVMQQLVGYVAPLILASIGAFYVAYADKYFIRLFGSLTDVGLYALAARLSSILGTVFEAFNMSWGADRFEVVKKENAQQNFEQIFRFMSAGIFLSGAGLALFASDFFRIMTHPDFYTAAYIVPLLVLAAIARVYVIFCNFGAMYRDSTIIMAQASWIKAVVATVGYLLLIPALGVYGAALVLTLSTVVELVWVHLKSARLYDMGLRWVPVTVIFVICSATVIVGFFLPEGELLYFFVRVLLYLVLVVSVVLLPIWNDAERQMMMSAVHKLTSRVPGLR